MQDGPYLDDADQAVRQGLVAVLADSYGPEPALHVVRATRTILLRAVRTRGAGPLAPWAPHYTVRTPYTRTSLGRAVRAAYCGTTGGGTPEMPGPNAPCGSWAGSSASTSCATGAAEAAVATAPIAVSAAWAEPTCATTALGAPGPKAPRSTWSVSSSLRTRM